MHRQNALATSRKLLWPDQFEKATSGLSGKQWGLVITVIVGFFLATREVGKLSGELMITDEAGVRQAVLSASQTFSYSAQTGTASIEIRQDGVRTFSASATVKATSGGAAAAGITALILIASGRQLVDRPILEISNVQFSGDISFLKGPC